MSTSVVFPIKMITVTNSDLRRLSTRGFKIKKGTIIPGLNDFRIHIRDVVQAHIIQYINPGKIACILKDRTHTEAEKHIRITPGITWFWNSMENGQLYNLEFCDDGLSKTWWVIKPVCIGIVSLFKIMSFSNDGRRPWSKNSTFKLGDDIDLNCRIFFSDESDVYLRVYLNQPLIAPPSVPANFTKLDRKDMPLYMNHATPEFETILRGETL